MQAACARTTCVPGQHEHKATRKHACALNVQHTWAGVRKEQRNMGEHYAQEQATRPGHLATKLDRDRTEMPHRMPPTAARAGPHLQAPAHERSARVHDPHGTRTRGQPHS
eukprot:75514-Alexandrium_andersonii.AAC.1